jgi:hypothetical protein
MTTSQWFTSLVLAVTVVPALAAKSHCPGNVASVPFRFINRHQIVLGVSINNSGPYNFLLDSGAQMTMIDRSLAADLHLDTQGGAVVASFESRQFASFAQLDLVEVGSHAVANQKVLVYDLQNFHPADLHLPGILGEDFLDHFDMLIDNAHSLLCLDNSPAMRAEVSGPHIPLFATVDPNDGVALPSLPIIAVRLSDGLRPVRLLLDSGTNTAILYNTSQFIVLRFLHNVPLRESGLDGAQRIVSALPPQDVEIGSLELRGVPFFSLVGVQKDALVKGFDGVLPTELFRRVFITYADRFVVLDPW